MTTRGELAAQDDSRENRLIDLFNLVRPPNRTRHGTDAVLLIDGQEIEFELKSVTTRGGSVSTVRDLGPDHITKWKGKHWIIARYWDGKLQECRYGTPGDMAPWITKIWEYIKPDFEMAAVIPGLIHMEVMYRLLGDKDRYTLADARQLHKSQFSSAEYRARMDLAEGYSRERMLEILRERCRYVIERGSTLNNPHIPGDFFKTWVSITTDHAVVLRDQVRTWLASVPMKSLEQGDTP